jgi:hypothetical protein
VSGKYVMRLNPRQDERCRSAIQTTQLCKRLNSFALGWDDPQTQRPVEMSDTQVRAALGLLRKTLPDLASTTINNADGSPMALQLIAAALVSAEITERQKTPVTIDAETAPPNLLDAPLPTE